MVMGKKRTKQRLAFDWGILLAAGIGTYLMAVPFWKCAGVNEAPQHHWLLYLVFYIGFGMSIHGLCSVFSGVYKFFRRICPSGKINIEEEDEETKKLPDI